MIRYVIVGNSSASISAIEGVRQVDREGTIVVITEERGVSYGRPLISYWLEGKVDDSTLSYRSSSFYQDNRVELIEGARAVRIDALRHCVILEDGREVPYDRLLIATGSRPFVPPVKGLGAGDYHTFINIDDARRVRASLGDDPARRSALVVGAGLSGLKCAEALKHLGADVTVVDLANRSLMRILDETGSRVVEGLLRGLGLKLELGVTLAGVCKPEDGRYHVELTNGIELDVDVIVMAIGVRPNVELVKDAGGAVNRGILVDSQLKTSLPDVYAAGDVAETPSMITGEVGLSQIMPNATIQGLVAGRNMAGLSETYSGSRTFNSLPVLGVSVVTMGVTDPGPGCEERGYRVLSKTAESSDGRRENVYRKLVLKDGRIVGGIFVNSPDGTGIIRHLIEDESDFRPDDKFLSRALDGDIRLIDLPDSIRHARLCS